MKNYEKADKDLLLSLELTQINHMFLIIWHIVGLKENKIKQSMEMLLTAYNKRQDDPYIIDSVGWAYFLRNDYVSAEKYLKYALLIMPNDPIVNDHYGDVLWKLNMRLQASYYWNKALSSDEAEEQMKKDINNKLLFGLK